VSEGPELFRKTALERLASPEQLDELIVVVSPQRWVALAALLSLLGMILVWSVLGRIPTTVQGAGLLLRTGGVQDVVAIAGGQVLELKVAVGDIVDEGAVLAVLAQPELEGEREQARSRLAELRIAHTMLTQADTSAGKARDTSMSRQMTNLRSSIGEAQRRLALLRERERAQKDLLERGLITKSVLQGTQAEIAAANAEIRAASVGVSETDVSAVEAKARRDAEVQASLLRMNESERALASVEERLARATKVVSPYRGRVLELKVDRGDLLSPGSAILNLDPVTDGASTTDSLEVLAYVAASEGKRLRPGMLVQVSPSTARKEEYGFLLGKVDFVADFPATERGMMRLLDNEQLVSRFVQAADGAPLMVKVRLIPDPRSLSGFAWSSGSGPPDKLSTGTPAQVAITVQERPPITLLVPALRRAFGL
jgi:HlyD family secretion protein